jgi:thiosulfate dehydrogenase [quinone] large subunit
MSSSNVDRSLLVFFRITMGWTFLYAGLTQLTDPDFTVASFLAHTKTFHDVLALFAAPAIAPVMTFLVSWGHTLIGLSLISGLMVRASAPFGMGLMAVYYLAHMDFPYIETHFNFLIDYHFVYVGILGLLMARRAGHVWGLDGWLADLPFFAQYPRLRPLIG